MDLLASRGFVGRDTVCCPHPEARASCTVVVYGSGGRPFASCPSCKAMFERLIEGWHSGELGPRIVAATMLESGYTRVDAARFVLQLAADSLRVRLGYRTPAEL